MSYDHRSYERMQLNAVAYRSLKKSGLQHMNMKHFIYHFTMKGKVENIVSTTKTGPAKTNMDCFHSRDQ